MKLLVVPTFVVAICCVSAGGKKLRMMAGLNGGMVNGANPGMMAGGFNPPIVAGGAGLVGQPQFAQVVPAIPAYAMQPQVMAQAPFGVPNAYPAPQVNAVPYMGVPQMAAMNPFPQQVMGVPGGPMQQQVPFQPDLMQRFKRHIVKQATSDVDTQIPTPAEAATPTPCALHQEGN